MLLSNLIDLCVYTYITMHPSDVDATRETASVSEDATSETLPPFYSHGMTTTYLLPCPTTILYNYYYYYYWYYYYCYYYYYYCYYYCYYRYYYYYYYCYYSYYCDYYYYH